MAKDSIRVMVAEIQSDIKHLCKSFEEFKDTRTYIDENQNARLESLEATRLRFRGGFKAIAIASSILVTLSGLVFGLVKVLGG
jgi:hypothetical protein